MAGRRAHLVAVQDSETISIWEPTTAPSPTAVANVPTEIVDALIDVLTRPLAPGEGHHVGNANRERALLALVAKLEPIHAFHLGRRIDIDRSDDALVVAFKRLVIERRQRLRAALQARRAR